MPVPGTLKAKAWTSTGRLLPSEVNTVNFSAITAANPTFSPGGSAQVGTSVKVQISCATAGATIRYTTDESEPTEMSKTIASGGTVSVPVPGTLKAKAWKEGVEPSVVKVARYTVAPSVNTPTFSPDGGGYTSNSVQVKVSCSESGATVRYTMDGSEPTETSQTVVSGAKIQVPVPGTLKAKAWKTGKNPSVTKTANYERAALTVTFDAQGGTSMLSQKVVYFGLAYGALPVPARKGYAFSGWWTEAAGTGSRVSAEAHVSTVTNHTLYAAWKANESVDWLASVGAAFGLTLSDAFAEVSKVTVAGLPAGLTYNAETRTVLGVPSKPGTFQVTVSAEGVGSRTFMINVETLPAWAQGTFNGYVAGHGPASMSATAAGKVTGKLVLAGTNYAFSVLSYASGNAVDGFTVVANAIAGKTVLPLKLALAATTNGVAASLGTAAGMLGDKQPVTLYRNVWKDAGMADRASSYAGYYTATLPGSDVYGSGYLTFTADKAGGVKTAGKLADGTAVSLSGTLILGGLRVFATLYTAPTTYKGGYFFGLAEFVAGAGAVYLRPLDGASFTWVNRNPQATFEPDKGFSRELGITGGWYSKTENLNTYYAGKILKAGADTNAPLPELAVGPIRYDSMCWDPSGVVLTPTLKSGVMTGLSAPAAGKPLDDDKNGVWDYSAMNSVALKVSLARPTGIFKGSFNTWFDYPEKKHVSKSLAFEGALTPVRENPDDGVAGRGFFLWSDKSLSPAYAFKWSYDFKILMTD